MTTQSVNILVFHHPRPPYLYSLPVPQSTSTNPPTISNMPKLKAKPSIALNPKVPDDTDLVDDKEVPICDYQPHLKRFTSYTKQIHSHQALPLAACTPLSSASALPSPNFKTRILKRDGVKAWGPRLLRSNCRVLEKERTLASYIQHREGAYGDSRLVLFCRGEVL